MKIIIRHGDIVLYQTNNKPTQGKHKDFVVAEGEATGHNHTIRGEVYGDRQLLAVPMPTIIDHPEHLPIELPTGNFDVLLEEEYDPFEEEMRKVID